MDKVFNQGATIIMPDGEHLSAVVFHDLAGGWEVAIGSRAKAWALTRDMAGLDVAQLVEAQVAQWNELDQAVRRGLGL